LSSLRLLVSAIAIAVCLAGTQVPTASAATSEAGRVLNFAKAQITKPYRYGAVGLRRYDCSGLVYRTFAELGLLKRIGGSRRTARGYFKWFKERGLLTRSPKKGDLVAWGSPVSHIGVFVGYNSNGKPLAVSALWRGVSKHTVGYMYEPLKAYLRVKLTR
jgi:cell wall-associated NlpC family hydrolase